MRLAQGEALTQSSLCQGGEELPLISGHLIFVEDNFA